jgi:lambda family phage portal protein
VTALSFLDRAIAAVAPQRALRRIEARTRIERLTQTRALYDAASLSRRTTGWRSLHTDANTETRSALARLRAVSREMVRNNAHAAKAKGSIATNMVGAGIVPQARADREARAKQIGELTKQHFDTTDIDADGRLNLYGLQSLAVKTVVEAGEVIIRKRIRRTSDGYALPFQLQMLEPDFLDTTFEGPLPSGNYAIQGVEFDLRGRRVAYYLFDQHPGSMALGTKITMRGQRVSADFVAHMYRVDRPGQVRGVTWFAPVIMRLRDYADYVDAQLMRQKIAACFAAFVTTTENFDPSAADTSTSGLPVETFEPGMIERLREGETVTFAQPPSTQDFGPYSTVTLREVAAGLGIPYEALTGDLSTVNFSSGRMGWLEFQRNLDDWRWNMLVPQMLDPLAAWTAEAATVVTGSTEPFRFTWTPPAREMIDPATETEAARSRIRSGLSSRSEEQRRQGYDPEELDQEIADDNTRADKLGLVFDSDPRRTTLRGQEQKTTPGASDVADALADAA